MMIPLYVMKKRSIKGEVFTLLAIDLKQEFRQRYGLYGILLFTVAAVYLIYTIFGSVSPKAWVSLYWLIILFSALQVVSRSILQQRDELSKYLYANVDPRSLILSKIIFNSMLLCLVVLLSFLFMWLWLGLPEASVAGILCTSVVAGFSLSCTLSLISAIALKAGNNVTLMSILSFPLVLPVLKIGAKSNLKLIKGEEFSAIGPELLLLFAILFLVISLALILYPFLWKQ